MSQPPFVSFIDDVYRSPPRRVSWIARWLPSLCFNLQFTWIVLRAAGQARRGRYDDPTWGRSSFSVLQALESVGVTFEIRGIQHVEQLDSACLFAANHLSSLETTVLPCLIQPHRRVTFVVKQELLTVPIFKYVMQSRDPVAVTQVNPREDLKTMFREGTRRLQDGVSIVIFPEGGRLRKFNPQQFNTIGVKLASRAKVPVIPVALKTDAWSPGKLLSDVGKIHPNRKVWIEFGSPLEVHGRGTDEQQKIIDFISGRLNKWEQKVPLG